MTVITKLQTENAPKAAGPYSQGIDAGSVVYVSGQLPVDHRTGQKVASDIKVQTAKVLENIQAILESAGLGLKNVVRCEVFLKDMGDFAAMNEVYASVFSFDPAPARQAFQVGALPLDAMVEISCIAHR